MLQGNLFPPETSWAPPGEFPELSGLVGFDFETRDTRMATHGPGWPFHDPDGYVIGVSIHVESTGFTGYYPVRHEGGGNLDEGAVKRWLRGQFKAARERGLELVIANNGYEPGWAARWLGEDVDLWGPVWHDVQVAAPLLDEHRWSYSLDNLAKDYLGSRKSSEGLRDATRAFGLKNPGADMWRLPAPYVGPYGEQDAVLPVQLWRKFRPMMEEQGLLDAYALEQELIQVLYAMRKRGVPVNVDRAERAGKALRARELEALAELKRLTGLTVDPYVAQACAAALATEGITCPMTEKSGQPSVTGELLDEAERGGSKVAGLIRRARKSATVRSTFIEGHILRHQVGGRIHAEFHSLRGERGGTETHRFSSSNPNLQNVPNPEKDPETSFEVRACFEPEEGETWAAPDYSSQEPRWLVNYAERIAAPGAEAVGDKYRADPRTDYHQTVADMAGISRKVGKIINLAIPYGQQPGQSCEAIGLPVEYESGRNGKLYAKPGPEGAAFLEAYHAALPFVEPLIRKAKRTAEQRGYIVLPAGYRKRFPLKDGQRWYTHKALNHLIQGSAAIQTKKAMVEVHKAGHKLLISVHDELGCSVRDGEEAARIAEIMCEVEKLTVPMVCDVALGPSWGEAK